jgi:hypothetical protein
MLWLVAAAALAAPAQPNGWSNGAVVQARASVRVISGVSLKLGSANPDAPRPRETRLTASDGTTRPARLIEFQ